MEVFMIRFIKALLWLIPTAFMGLTMFFVPEIADTTSIFYVGLIGVFLGVDMVAMIKKTKEMSNGEFDTVKIWRYVLVVLALASLLTVAFIQYKSSKIMVVTIGSFAAAVYLIAGILLAGLDGNKIATGEAK